MARWQPVPIVGGSYADETRPWSHQETVNWLPMRAERAGGRSGDRLKDVPGLRPFGVVGDGPVRGAHNVEGRYFIVTGDKLYQVGVLGTGALIGTIPGAGLVTMAHNQLGLDGGNELVVGTVSSGYTYNLQNGAFSQITDEGFPGLQSVDFIGGYIIGIEPQRRYWFHSALADARNYNTTDIYSAESAPDKLTRVIVANGQVVAVGERSTEFFVNEPTATAAFQRVPGVSNGKGSISPHSICVLDNSVWMLGADGIVYRLEGYSWVRMSHHPLEQAIARCNLSRAFAFTYEDRGHAIYYLTLPDGQTWGFDISQGEWARRESHGLDRWRVNALTRWNGGWYAGDYASGLLYRLDWDYHKEGSCDPLVRLRRTAVQHDHGNRVFVNAVKLEVDTGQPETPAAEPSITGALPDGVVNIPITAYQLTVTRAYPGQTYTVTATGLPPGLTCSASGLITGTPTEDGDFTPTYTVTADCHVATHDDAVTIRALIVMLFGEDGTTDDKNYYGDHGDWTGVPYTDLGQDYVGAYGDGWWVVAKQAGCSRSADLLTWTAGTMDAGAASMDDMAYGNSVFIAVGPSTGIYRSADFGQTFAKITPESSSGGGFNCVGYGAGRWIVGGSGTPNNNQYSLDDGATWTAYASDIVPYRMSDIAYAGTAWVAVGGDSSNGEGVIMRSSDGGATFATIKSGMSSMPTQVCGDGSGLWVVVCLNGTVWYSDDDALTFTLSATDLGDGGTAARLVHTGGHFLFVQSNGLSDATTSTSATGETWSSHVGTGLADITGAATGAQP